MHLILVVKMLSTLIFRITTYLFPYSLIHIHELDGTDSPLLGLSGNSLYPDAHDLNLEIKLMEHKLHFLNIQSSSLRYYYQNCKTRVLGLISLFYVNQFRMIEIQNCLDCQITNSFKKTW